MCDQQELVENLSELLSDTSQVFCYVSYLVRDFRISKYALIFICLPHAIISLQHSSPLTVYSILKASAYGIDKTEGIVTNFICFCCLQNFC